MTMGLALFHIIVFPGLLFLIALSLAAEYFDRKINARLQNRIGPSWYQPLADITKLFGKETIVPREADERLFRAIPIVALAATVTAFLYIPIWGKTSLYPFHSDLVVVLYFLTIPTLTFFIAGWFSSSLYSEIGSIRALTQFFAYEVPFYMSLLSPALLSGSWSISTIAAFYHRYPLLLLCNLPSLFVALFAAQGKLERTPFDIPDAETEIVGGTFTEYSGRLLAFFRLTLDCELVVISALIAAVFFPLFLHDSAVLGFVLFLLKVFAVVFLLSLLRTALARFRIDQMINFCWKILAPVSLLQILFDLIVKGMIMG